MWDKKGYVVYGEMLDFYLRHSVQMTHIYCIITFRVANWLKPYIELNTKLQNEAKHTGNALGITVFKGRITSFMVSSSRTFSRRPA